MYCFQFPVFLSSLLSQKHKIGQLIYSKRIKKKILRRHVEVYFNDIL